MNGFKKHERLTSKLVYVQAYKKMTISVLSFSIILYLILLDIAYIFNLDQITTYCPNIRIYCNEVILIEPILTIQHVKKDFHHQPVLKDISFTIPKGSIFAILGLNGAGKSTLLHIIMQILLPTSGKVQMNGKPILKDKIGVVFQENTLDEELTIYENLVLRGRLYQIKRKQLHQRIMYLVKELGMESYLDKKYKHCSGGQKRIAMIARALLMNPEIIIMDEPTTALDIETRKKVWNILLKLNREQQLTIFFSSHYIEEAQIATNLCILKNGIILFHGTYQTLISKYGKKQLQVQLHHSIIKKEISSIHTALHYLSSLDFHNIETFSLSNSNLEDIFLKLVDHENTCL